MSALSTQLSAVIAAGTQPAAMTPAPSAAGRRDAPLPLVILSAVAGAATLWLLDRRLAGPARLSAVLAVESVVAGWVSRNTRGCSSIRYG